MLRAEPAQQGTPRRERTPSELASPLATPRPPQNAGRARERAPPLRAYRGMMHGRPPSNGSASAGALRRLPGRCGEGPSAMRGAWRREGAGPGRGEARRGQHPPAGLSRRAVRASGAATPPCAPIEKRPPRARRPALPQPSAAVLSAKAGLTAGFGMGPGDPRLCGRARGGRSPAAHVFEPARSPCRGDPGGRMAGTDRRSRIALGALIEDAKSSGY